ncbi:MAG: methyltransferase domain-containing protein [Patescibacteria group bacterium]|nr:methyltransferase domain-containing protein [Patescibacteria group bacterium]
MKNKNTSWGAVADWYDNVAEGDTDSYQNKVIMPNILRLADIKAGERVIDIACGQGMFSRAFAKLGASVIGTDISPELVSIASKKSAGMDNVSFKVAKADDMNELSGDSFDKAFIILALQNMSDINTVIAECSRLLTGAGKLFLVINHPTFRVPKHSDWGYDEEKKTQYRREDRYMSDISVPIKMNPGDKNSEETITFHRPLQVYFKSLRRSGFVVTALEEWISHKKSQNGPRAKVEDEARKEFPLFMALVAEKK